MEPPSIGKCDGLFLPVDTGRPVLFEDLDAEMAIDGLRLEGQLIPRRVAGHEAFGESRPVIRQFGLRGGHQHPPGETDLSQSQRRIQAARPRPENENGPVVVSTGDGGDLGPDLPDVDAAAFDLRFIAGQIVERRGACTCPDLTSNLAVCQGQVMVWSRSRPFSRGPP